MTPTRSAAEIVEHYRAKGLRGPKLRRQVAKHAQLISVFDYEMALELLEAPLNPAVQP